MAIQLIAPNKEPIAYFQDDRLIFYPYAETYIVAANLMQRGIELPLQLRKQYGCNRIDYPAENAPHSAIQLYKKAFLDFYFPHYLKPWRFELLDVPMPHV